MQRERVTKAKSKREALKELRAAIEDVEHIRGRHPIRTMLELKTYCGRWLAARAKSCTELDKR